MSRWNHVQFWINPERLDETIGDRGMIGIDAAIFAEVIAKMMDREREKFMDSREFAEDGFVEFGNRETRCWMNANRSVNW